MNASYPRDGIKLKILLITEASSAGVGRHLLDLMQGLLDLNVEVHLVYSEWRVDDMFANGLKDLTKLRLYRVDMHRSLHLSDLKVIGKVRRYLREQGPFDVVHGHSSKGGGVARLAAWGHGASLVYTPHCIFTMNPTIGKLGYFIVRMIESTLALWTDAVIAVSEEEHKHLVRTGSRSRKAHLIPNGIAARPWSSRESVRRSIGVTDDQVLIGFLGRLSSQKNPLLLVDAFAELAPRYPQATLLLVGEGPLKTEVTARITQMGLEERVICLGYRHVEDILPGFDVFALPSRYEGMPYVLLEALSVGLPIVATRVGGVASVVTSDTNGIIVTSNSHHEFAAALDLLISNGNERRRMGQASARKAGEFPCTRMVNETFELYQSLSPR